MIDPVLHSAAAIANTPGIAGVVSTPAPLYTPLTSQSTPQDIAAAPAPVVNPIEQLYTQYAGRGSDPGGLEYWSKQFGSEVDPNEAAIFQRAVAEGVAKGIESTATGAGFNPYFSLNPDVAKSYMQNTYGLTPEQFAQQHYEKYGASEGRITPTNTAIVDAFNRYKDDFTSGIASKVFGAFGADAKQAPPLTGILSGFEAMGRGDFTEEQAKRLLGEDAYGQYKNLFGQEAKNLTTNILADKNLSGQEALDFVKNARKYGLDADELAGLTGYRKELYDNIFKGYDKTVDTLVDKSLEGKTELGDRIKTGLALQSQYGLTNEDIAKATGMTIDEVKANFDPVRSFSEQLNAATKKADATGKDILSFLETAKKSAPVTAVYGSNLDALEKKINDLNTKWKDYGVDGYQAENIYNQINKITEAAGGKNWSGSWGGGGDSASMAAAQKLVQKGVDNLADLKVEKNFEKTQATGESYNGQTVNTDEDGRKFIVKPDLFTDGVTYEYLPKDAKTQPMYTETVGSGDEAYTKFRPLTVEELKTYDAKTGKFDLASGNKLVDASSGKVVSKSDDNNFVIDQYRTGNFFKGKNKTMGIMVTDQGVPVPYQAAEKRGMVYSPVFPIIASALLPGVGSALSSGIASAGGSALASGSLANAALTRGIIGGVMGEATGAGFGKGFLGGAVTPVISSGISSLLPTGMDPGMAKTLTNVGTTAATSALTGRPIDLTSTLINAGVQYGAQQLPFNLTPDQLNLLSGVATPLLQGQSISPTALTGILANYALSSQKPTKGAR